MKKKRQPGSFVVCLAAKPDEDVEVGKVYQTIPDDEASKMGCLRVIDESGEDYLYSTKRFIAIDLPAKARGRLIAASRAR